MKHTLAIAALVLGLAACKPAEEAPPAKAAAAPVAPAPVQTFRFGNHVPPAVITAVTGTDTASAILAGHVTAEANHAYCLDMTGGADSSEAVTQCEAENRDQPEQRMTADCIARTISDGSDAVWVRDEPAEGGKVMPVWRDRASGDIRDYSGAGGGYVLTAAFRILCPKASADIAPDPF
ncbi:hypothetical protein [Brevundimonas sp. NIBR11]|uniref:hypothetical protein n=1 Tax=Brevundimonas sp. NIBR11 TaxID=3015999 RepID=UPI0022F115D1|nr:hypothetical protein [Brevundimonas sp. NIBR11]WGM32895.1 hypothetical protein KKHFBJBL_03151 [Brevundimonas sp. NIBR11]